MKPLVITLKSRESNGTAPLHTGQGDSGIPTALWAKCLKTWLLQETRSTETKLRSLQKRLNYAKDIAETAAMQAIQN